MNDQFAQRSRDKITLMQLAEVAEPTAYDKVILGALLMRYPSGDFSEDVRLVARCWKLTPKALFLECRRIWADGFRPEDLQEEGSAWDASSGD